MPIWYPASRSSISDLDAQLAKCCGRSGRRTRKAVRVLQTNKYSIQEDNMRIDDKTWNRKYETDHEEAKEKVRLQQERRAVVIFKG